MTALEGSDWSPTEEVATDVVAAARAAALHGLLDAPGDPPGEGAPLPILWHWLAFLSSAPQSQLGPDGHPRLGGLLPPIPLPRRMFGAGEVTLGAAGEPRAEAGPGAEAASGAGELRVGKRHRQLARRRPAGATSPTGDYGASGSGR